MLCAVAAMVALGCSGAATDPWEEPAGDLDDVPDFESVPAAAPGWVKSQSWKFWNHFGELGDRPAPGFGRARLTLLSCNDELRYLCREFSEGTTRYIRLEPEAGGYRIMPQCSALAEDWNPVGGVELWRMTSGTVGPNATLEFVASNPTWPPPLDPRQDLPRLRVETELWWTPPSPPLYAWSHWLYTRSLISTRASWAGLDIDVHGGRDCADFWSPAAYDACRATGGGPLALLMDPTKPQTLTGRLGPSGDVSKIETRRLVSEVGTGSYQGFCGRWAEDTYGLTPEVVDSAMRPYADELEAFGVDPARYVAGALLAFEGQYYPLVSVLVLAHVVRWLDWSARVTPAVRRLAHDPELDWQNRFRARAFLRFLAGERVELTEFRDLVPAQPNRHGEASQAADEACIWGLLGGMNFGCHAG